MRGEPHPVHGIAVPDPYGDELMPRAHDPTPRSHAPTILAIGAATFIGCLVVSRWMRGVRHEMRRVHDLGERIVSTEQTILTALCADGDDGDAAVTRLIS